MQKLFKKKVYETKIHKHKKSLLSQH
jgi:hypothetical protein